MSETIVNGADGAGYEAKVDKTNRLHTRSVSLTEQEEALENGKDWNIETGTINLTTANASGLMYLKNKGEKNLKVKLYVFLIDPSTGGAGGKVLIEILRNPTGGTVVTDANVANSVNMNFGSSNEIEADVYYGAEGKTLTGQDNIIVSKTTDDTRMLLGIFTELPRGASLGLRLTPPTGNTSMNVNSILEAYEAQGI